MPTTSIEFDTILNDRTTVLCKNGASDGNEDGIKKEKLN